FNRSEHRPVKAEAAGSSSHVTPLTVGLTFRHASNGGVDDRQLDDAPSLVLSRIGPFNLKETELATDRQTSDGPLWQPSPRPKFPGRLFQCVGRGDSPSVK
ncbi:hypothetical protein HAX54_008775, partial [Datura stramonium]|nr:hypothetical protein [Datura stramonium]